MVKTDVHMDKVCNIQPPLPLFMIHYLLYSMHNSLFQFCLAETNLLKNILILFFCPTIQIGNVCKFCWCETVGLIPTPRGTSGTK